MKKYYQAIIFDFDGVLAETMQDNLKAWAMAFHDFGIPFDADEDGRDYYLSEGLRAIEIAQKYVLRAGVQISQISQISEEHLKNIMHAKEQNYELHNHFRLYEGVEEFIKQLQKLNIPIGLVTGANRLRVEATLKKVFSTSPFQAIVTANDVEKGKPFPDPYLKAAIQLGKDPYDCLVVENAPLGIKAAKSAGMDCVAIASTLKPADLSFADRVITNFSELFNQITLTEKKVSLC